MTEIIITSVIVCLLCKVYVSIKKEKEIIHKQKRKAALMDKIDDRIRKNLQVIKMAEDMYLEGEEYEARQLLDAAKLEDDYIHSLIRETKNL